MYFYVYNGQLYWGRHQILAPHRNVLTWIFRNKPVKACRMYLTGKESFIATSSTDSKIGRAAYTVMIHTPNNNNGYVGLKFFVEEGYCYYISDGVLSLCASTDKNETNRQQFKRTFKNRLKEYKGRYFLPIDKHSNYA